jgi:hypothetical protein
VYPRTIRTVADQLTAKGDTWKAYIEGVDSGPSGQPTACRHPTLGAADADQAPRPGDPYVTWRNPFVYFRSLTHGTACHKNDVGLGGLAFDLQDARTAPTLAYIAPGPCDDGNPQPCNAGSDGGLAAADRFLETVVPEIEQSAAYRDNGLIAITSDEAPQTGPNADSSACCDTPKYPNIPDAAVNTPTTTTSTTTTSTTTTTTTPTTSTTTTPTTSSSGTTPVNGGQTTPTGGGGQVGLLLISKFVKKGSADLVDYYNHYSLLATIENLFGLKRLGYAGHLGLPVFDASIFDHQPAGAAADRGDSRMTIEAVPRTPCEARPLNPVRARTKGTARPAPQSSRPGCMSTKP